jgi:two-component system invasion response regulator UvrY
MCAFPHFEESTDSCARRSILIVEDHAAIATALQVLLRRAFPACQLHVADTAESALTHCEAQAPDIVIMDISLPGMNGIEATRRIKAMCPATDVVMHTGNDMPIFQEESATVGATAFVSKRDTTKSLVPVISRLMAIAD